MKTNLKRAVTVPLEDAKPAPQPSRTKQKRAPNTKSLPTRNERLRGQSKQDRVVAMLQHKEGTTVAAVMKATGWQKHSVHGFLAGVVRKRLGFNLLSEKSDGKRIYRIVAGKAAKTIQSKRKRAG